MASSSIIKVLIKGDASDLNSAMGKGQASLKKFAIAGGIAVGAAAVLGKALIDAGERASTSNARILNITEQMGLFGSEAGKVSERLVKLAEATARQTGVDQNAIKMTQAKLMTFAELGATADEVGGAFDRATAAAVDMAAAGFGEAEMNAVQLGKALQDPIKGITALGRSGVTFTDAEKEMIKAMVEAGDTAGAQEMILAAVEKQVGGTAKATANASDKMRVAFSQVQEKVGQKLLPVFEKLTSFLVGKVIPAAEKMVGFIKNNWIPIVAGLAAGFLALIPTLVSLAAAGWAAVAPMLVAAAPFLAVGAAIAGLTAGVMWLYENWTPFHEAVDATVKFFTDEVLPVFQGFVDFIMDEIVPAFQAIVSFIVDELLPPIWSIAQMWIDIQLKIAEMIIKIVGGVSGMVADIIGFFADLVSSIKGKVDAIVGFVTGIAGRIAYAAATMWGAIQTSVTAAKDWVKARFDDVVGIVTGLPGRIADAAVGMWDGIKDAFVTMMNWVIDKWNSIDMGFSVSIPSWVPVIGGKGFSIPDLVPDIPRLASGGIVSARPGGTLALLGEGGRDEAVIPLGRNGMIDTDAIAEAVERGMRNGYRAMKLNERAA